jgi:hypothetical protein
MFTQTWNKYLPVIKILINRSATGKQTLGMNQTDFERAAGGRKVKYSFNFTLNNGRVQNKTVLPPLARELAALLNENETTKKIIRTQELEFSMNADFQLTIKNITPPAEEPSETPQETPETTPE